MQKSLMACALIVGFSAMSQAYAVDCSQLASWDKDTEYNSGTKVQSSGIAYKANWWSLGNEPASNSGPWQNWTNLGNCDGSQGNQLPAITLTSPLHNAQFTESDIVVLTATAHDPDGTVESVEFFLGSQSLGTVTAFPYTLDWTSVAGSYSIEARVTDDQGASSSTAVNITVLSATNNLPPVVSLTSPTSTSQITSGDNVVISANAADEAGAVTQVDFYINDQLIGTDSSAPYEYSWIALEGTHSFKAKATDIENASTFSKTSPSQ